MRVTPKDIDDMEDRLKGFCAEAGDDVTIEYIQVCSLCHNKHNDKGDGSVVLLLDFALFVVAIEYFSVQVKNHE